MTITLWSLVYHTYSYKTVFSSYYFLGMWKNLLFVLEFFVKGLELSGWRIDSKCKSIFFLFSFIFLLRVYNVIKKAVYGWNMFDCRKTNQKNARYYSRDYFCVFSSCLHKKADNKDFDQGLGCVAPRGWSKYTTNIDETRR